MLRIALVTILASACMPMTQAREARLNQLCSDPRSAYEDGYNHGMQRAPMDSGWVDAYCVPQNRDQQRQAYLAGYRDGAQHAPTIAVQGGFGYSGYAAAPAPTCRAGSDGIHVCGYNCTVGADGHAYCSSVPNGTCALNSDGTESCP